MTTNRVQKDLEERQRALEQEEPIKYYDTKHTHHGCFIDPRNWVQVNKLCNWKQHESWYPVIGDFQDYIEFDTNCTQELMDKAKIFCKSENKEDDHRYGEELSKVFQYEKSFFICSILTANVRIVQIYFDDGGFGQWLVFGLGTHKNHETKLYGLGKENHGYSRRIDTGKRLRKYPPKWLCTTILTQSEVIAFFKSIICDDGCHWDENDERYFEAHILPQSLEPRRGPYGAPFDSNLEIHYTQFVADLYNQLFWYDLAKRGIRTRELNPKRKNKNGFNKIDYLWQMMNELKVNTFDLVVQFVHAIEKSISFGKLHNETVQTQINYNRKSARIHFEYVLYCDILNVQTGKYCKFGLALAKRGDKYVIEALLTPKMAADNISLNDPKTRWKNERDSEKWHMTIEDPSFSFYVDYYCAQQSKNSMTCMPVELKENAERYLSAMKCGSFVKNGNEKILTFEETEKIRCLDGLAKQRQEFENMFGDDKERIDSLNKVVNGEIKEDYYNYGSSSNETTAAPAPTPKLSPSKVQLHQEKIKVDRSKQKKKEKIDQHKIGTIKETEAMEEFEAMTEDKADWNSSLWKNTKVASFKPSWIPAIKKINDNLKKILCAAEKNVNIIKFVTPVIDKFVEFYSSTHYGSFSWSDAGDDDYKKVEYTPREKIIEKDALWQGLQVFGREYFPFLTGKYLEDVRKQYNNSKQLNSLGAKIEEDYLVAAKRAAEKAVVVETKEVEVKGETVEKMSALISIKKEMDDGRGDKTMQGEDKSLDEVESA